MLIENTRLRKNIKLSEPMFESHRYIELLHCNMHYNL
uniref:Uncharacterized protein n=1 Tax=Arundo donax TaxID=35708 RepID=A0A0A9DY86_ARUDO